MKGPHDHADVRGDMMERAQTLTVGSLFSGVGGFDLGLERDNRSFSRFTKMEKMLIAGRRSGRDIFHCAALAKEEK